MIHDGEAGGRRRPANSTRRPQSSVVLDLDGEIHGTPGGPAARSRPLDEQDRTRRQQVAPADVVQLVGVRAAGRGRSDARARARPAGRARSACRSGCAPGLRARGLPAIPPTSVVLPAPRSPASVTTKARSGSVASAAHRPARAHSALRACRVRGLEYRHAGFTQVRSWAITSPASMPRSPAAAARSPATACTNTPARAPTARSPHCAAMPAIDARQHVAHSRDGHAGIAAVADPGAAVRGLHDRARTLQHHRPAVARAADAAAVPRRSRCTSATSMSEQPRRLAGVRRQHPVVAIACGACASRLSASASTTSGLPAASAAPHRLLAHGDRPRPGPSARRWRARSRPRGRPPSRARGS